LGAIAPTIITAVTAIAARRATSIRMWRISLACLESMMDANGMVVVAIRLI
jgi:hypothetical protein